MGNMVITIGRQFGSNGRTIGKFVAEKLGIDYYDKAILTEAAKNTGLSEEILKSLDEKPTKSFLYSVVMDPYSFVYNAGADYTMNLNQQAFKATYDTIKKIASEKPCVIVGRCSDYVLRHNEDVLDVFIYAPIEDRIKTVMERFSLTEKQAKDQIAKEDKARAAYYNYYTSKKWGSVESYDLCINSSLLTSEQTAEYIVALAKEKFDL